MAAIGEKRNVLIQGRKVPGIVIGETTTTMVQVPSKSNPGTLRNQPTQFADILTLRETNPANGPVRQYRVITPENLYFAPPRFNVVEGLDVEGGAALDLAVLVERATDDMIAFQLAKVAATAEPELDLA